MGLSDKTKFLIRNIIKGILWLSVIILIFLLLRKYVRSELLNWIEPLYKSPSKMYILFLLSEVFFGIIPPEIFMIWALKGNTVEEYRMVILLLTIISYTAGIIGYTFGRYLNTTRLYRFLKSRFLKRYEATLNKYGVYLIIVASLTPIPYSAICMLVGSIKYPAKKFFLYSGFRIVRFIVYSFLIWKTNFITL